MQGLYHPFTRALYEQDGTGNVRVSLEGRWGRFRPDGRWIEGEIFEADPQLCGWVAGPRMTSQRAPKQAS